MTDTTSQARSAGELAGMAVAAGRLTPADASVQAKFHASQSAAAGKAFVTAYGEASRAAREARPEQSAGPEVDSPEVAAAKAKALAVNTDTKLAAIYGKQWALREQQDRLRGDIQRTSGSTKTSGRWSSGPTTWDRSINEALNDFQGQPYDKASWSRSTAAYRSNEAKLALLDEEKAGLEALWTEHRWTRAFLVTNQGGHVHRAMSCSTCYPTTRFNWLPEYSGSDEAQIVEDAGERACTVCYPSAPVDTRNRPTKIFSEDEKRQNADRIERARLKIERDTSKAAKAITNSDGSELRVQDSYAAARGGSRGEILRTERAAQIWYVDKLAELLVMGVNPEHRYGLAYRQEAQDQILAAIAAKHGKTSDEVQTELAPKAKAKANKILREGYPGQFPKIT